MRTAYKSGAPAWDFNELMCLEQKYCKQTPPLQVLRKHSNSPSVEKRVKRNQVTHETLLPGREKEKGGRDRERSKRSNRRKRVSKRRA